MSYVFYFPNFFLTTHILFEYLHVSFALFFSLSNCKQLCKLVVLKMTEQNARMIVSSDTCLRVSGYKEMHVLPVTLNKTGDTQIDTQNWNEKRQKVTQNQFYLLLNEQ